MAAERLVMTSRRRALGQDRAELAQIRADRVQRTTHPLVWDDGPRPLLLLPTWALFGGLGFLLAYIGRRPAARQRVRQLTLLALLLGRACPPTWRMTSSAP